jgi:hypothetical protein
VIAEFKVYKEKEEIFPEQKSSKVEGLYLLSNGKVLKGKYVVLQLHIKYSGGIKGAV